MYNNKIKSRFISEQYADTPRLAKVAKTLFATLSKYENEWQNDACTVSAEALSSALAEMKPRGIFTNSSDPRKTVLVQYVKWCLENNIPDANPEAVNIATPPVKKEVIEQCLFKSPKELSGFLDDAFDDEDKNSLDLTLRGMCWLAYMGFSETDALKVCPEHINFEAKIVTYNGESYPLYPQSIKCISKCVQLKSFTIVRRLYQTEEPRIDGNTILRGIVESSTTVQKMRHSMSRKITKAMNDGMIDRRVNYNQVWISGLFYRAYQSELTPEEYFERIVKKQMMGVDYKLGRGATINTIKNRHINKYLNSYGIWLSSVIFEKP